MVAAPYQPRGRYSSRLYSFFFSTVVDCWVVVLWTAGVSGGASACLVSLLLDELCSTVELVDCGVLAGAAAGADAAAGGAC